MIMENDDIMALERLAAKLEVTVDELYTILGLNKSDWL